MCCVLPWLNTVGLSLAFLGSLILASQTMLTEDQAREVGVPRWAGSDNEENLQLPFVQLLIRQTRLSRLGAGLLAVGFLLQLLGSWPD
jgi:hypothetical protein